MLLKTNGAYGARIGNKIVFTREGAIELYKIFLEVCYSGLNMGSTIALSNVENDMVNTGFTWEEIEKIETEYLQAMAEVVR